MAIITEGRFSETTESKRFDAEYFASPYVGFLDRMFTGWTSWVPLRDTATKLTSGHTPLRHNVSFGDCPFVTVECIDPLTLNLQKAKRVWKHHVNGELRRVKLRPGDVLITIKRRIANSCVVLEDLGDVAVNQDVAVLTPKPGYSSTVLAAALSSRIVKTQAHRKQTEQMNPYISVGSLASVLVPVLPAKIQTAVDETVRSIARAIKKREQTYTEAKMLLESALGFDRLDLQPRLSYERSIAEVGAAARLDAEYACVPDLLSVWEPSCDVQPLGNYAIAKHIGNGVTPAASEYGPNGIPIIKVGDISEHGSADFGGEYVTPGTKTLKSGKGRIQPGDVMVLAAAHHVRYIGKAGLLEAWPDSQEQCQSVGELIAIRPGDSVAGEVLMCYLNAPTIRVQVQRLVRGQSAHLYPKDLSTLPVPIIDGDLQKQIVSKVRESFESQRDALRLVEQATATVEQAILGSSDVGV